MHRRSRVSSLENKFTVLFKMPKRVVLFFCFTFKHKWFGLPSQTPYEQALVSRKYNAAVAFGCCYVATLNFEGQKNASHDFTNFWIQRNNSWLPFTLLNQVIALNCINNKLFYTNGMSFVYMHSSYPLLPAYLPLNGTLPFLRALDVRSIFISCSVIWKGVKCLNKFFLTS